MGGRYPKFGFLGFESKLNKIFHFIIAQFFFPYFKIFQSSLHFRSTFVQPISGLRIGFQNLKTHISYDRIQRECST